MYSFFKAGIMTLTVSCGAFFGGLITKKFKLSPRMMLVVVIILHVGQMVFHGGLIFIGCPQPDIVGPKKQVYKMLIAIETYFYNSLLTTCFWYVYCQRLIYPYFIDK
jgi:hypothetical protein